MSTDYVKSYEYSSFFGSSFFNELAKKLHNEVNFRMVSLSEQGKVRNFISRVVSPFVGMGTLLVSLCLRVASIVEPIIGVFADIFAAIGFREPAIALHIVTRTRHIFRNLGWNSILILIDIAKIGFVAAIGGIIAPKAAYSQLSKLT